MTKRKIRKICRIFQIIGFLICMIPFFIIFASAYNYINHNTGTSYDKYVEMLWSIMPLIFLIALMGHLISTVGPWIAILFLEKEAYKQKKPVKHGTAKKRKENMAMLQVICKDCGEESSLRGWIEKEDLIGTKYEDRMESITEKELFELAENGKVKDEWDRWDGKCPVCGSTNVISF